MTDIDNMMTTNELEESHCGDLVRHAPHPYETLTVEAQPTGVPAEYGQFRCSGEGVVTAARCCGLRVLAATG